MTSDKILDGSIGSADIATGAIENGDIAFGTIDGNKLKDETVTSAEILNGTVSLADLADNSVNSSKITFGGVATSDLADGAVTSLKIADGTITSADLAPGVVDGGDADTVDGLEASQFLRADTNDVISGGSTWSVAGGSPNSLTFGGANLELNLGDSSADTTVVRGSLTAESTLAVNGNTTLGDAATDSTTVNGNLTVFDGDLIFGTAGGFLPEIDAQNGQLLISPPIVQMFGNLLLDGNASSLVFTDSNADPRINVNGPAGPDSKLTIDGLNMDLILGSSSSDEIIVEGVLRADSGVIVNPGNFLTASDIRVDDIRMGDSEGDHSLFFYDGGSSSTTWLRWDDVTNVTGCSALPNVTSGFVWNIQNNSNTGWVLQNSASDNEFVFHANGNAEFDGSITSFGSCDVAESFFGEDMEPGTVVRLDPAQPESVLRTTSAYDTTSSPAWCPRGPGCS